MRSLFLAAAILLTPLSAFAADATATATSASTPETQALARRLIEVSGAGADLHARMHAMTDPVMRALAGSLSADQQAKREAMMAMVQDQVAADEPLILDAAAQAYAATFTADELRQLLDFYRTPTGRMLVSKQGVLATQMGQTTAKLAPKLMRDILLKICSQTTCPLALQQRLGALSGG